MTVPTGGNSVELVYDRYAAMLVRLACSILVSREDAEDAVQNVFCKYLKKLPSFQDSEQEKAWFIRVTINQCKDALRRRKLRSHPGLETAAGIGKEDDRFGELLEILFSLPEKYKTPLILHHLEDLPVEQTAKALGISLSAVKMRLSRGRAMLKERLEDVEDV